MHRRATQALPTYARELEKRPFHTFVSDTFLGQQPLHIPSLAHTVPIRKEPKLISRDMASSAAAGPGPADGAHAEEDAELDEAHAAEEGLPPEGRPPIAIYTGEKYSSSIHCTSSAQMSCTGAPYITFEKKNAFQIVSSESFQAMPPRASIRASHHAVSPPKRDPQALSRDSRPLSGAVRPDVEVRRTLWFRSSAEALPADLQP